MQSGSAHMATPTSRLGFEWQVFVAEIESGEISFAPHLLTADFEWNTRAATVNDLYLYSAKIDQTCRIFFRRSGQERLVALQLAFDSAMKGEV
jgi:hypothetical protein